jgi:hypothetical protein
MDGLRDLTRDEIKGLLRSCMIEAEIWIAQAERRLSQLYPHGAKVEVQLRNGQHNWTPAVVVSSGINAYGASTYASVRVEIPYRTPGGKRQRFRTVNLDCIRPLTQENS